MADEEVGDTVGELEDKSSKLPENLGAELDANQRELLRRVRKSVHLAKTSGANLRLANTDEATGMKSVDMDALLGLIKESETKMAVQKEAARSKKLVDDISVLLANEGFM